MLASLSIVHKESLLLPPVPAFRDYLKEVKALEADTKVPCLFRRFLRATMYRELASKR